MSLETAVAISESVRTAGGRALVVGGWVRDRLIGVLSTNVDLEVFGVAADELRRLLEPFGRVEAVGASFQVYKVAGIDVSLPRRDSKSGRGHRGFAVTGDPSMTVEEAARRRDFTINAISWDPLTDEYLDPCHGRDDLARRLLRVVDASTFSDDSLRVLRAVQFAARFSLTIDSETRELCRAIPLDDLPAERVWGEMEKLLMAERPSIGLALALDLRVVQRLFPELFALVGCEQEPEWHPEGDVWVHTLQVVDQARTRIADLPRPQQITVMLGALAHDLGKPATTAFIDGRIRSIDHEEQGVAPATAFLDRLNIHTIDGYDVRHQVLGMTAQHLKPGMWFKVRDEVGDGAFRRLAQKVDLELLARLAKSDCLGRSPGTFNCEAMDWFLERARTLGVEHRPPGPILLGRHLLELGMRPGPAIGNILKAVYEQQLDGKVTDLPGCHRCRPGAHTMTPFAYRLDRSIVVHAEPKIVFRFFQERERWASWWGAGSTIEAQPRGRVLIRHADGVDVVGEVLEVHAPEHIVFSYGVLDRRAAPAGDSRVTIDLEPLGHSTRLHLTHEFSDPAGRDEHVQAWRFQLSIFANVVANEVHANVAQAIDGWFNAWSVLAPEARREAFARVSSNDVGLRDRFSLIDGLDDLVAHTAAYQRFFPGLRFERKGDVRHCQGVVLADWITHADAGTGRLNGTCCFTFNTDNRIEAVINFISSANDKQ